MERGSRTKDGDYAQTLSFRGDGKIVQQPQLSDYSKAVQIVTLSLSKWYVW